MIHIAITIRRYCRTKYCGHHSVMFSFKDTDTLTAAARQTHKQGAEGIIQVFASAD